ncbi:MAG: SDR family oxidoreductase [Kofleriaceae bacterium]
MKTAIVTGASRGVGLAVAERLIAKGWQIVGLARDVGPLHRAKEQLGERFSFETVDLRDAQSVRQVFERIGARLGVFELLVNNAAVFKMKPFRECDDADIDAMIDTNLKGPLRCTLAALKWMRAGSRIINVGSVAGTHGIENQAIYCASKFGLEGFADALGQEVKMSGIAITSICPGGIDTPLWNASNPYPGDLSQILQPADVASLVEYVAELPPHVVLKRAVVFPTNEWH